VSRKDKSGKTITKPATGIKTIDIIPASGIVSTEVFCLTKNRAYNRLENNEIIMNPKYAKGEKKTVNIISIKISPKPI
jgi:hypothetical protein